MGARLRLAVVSVLAAASPAVGTRCAPLLGGALNLPHAAAPLSRRAVLLGLGVAGGALRAEAIDDEDEEDVDIIPLLSSTSGMKRRSKPSESNVKKTYTAAEAAYAFADIVACRSGVSQIEQLIRSGDFGSAASLLGKPPFSSFKQNALVLVNSKLLTPEDIKAIGTEKRFGVGADVLLMLGGLADATERSDKSGALDYATKAKSSLDEIIAIGRGAGL